MKMRYHICAGVIILCTDLSPACSFQTPPIDSMGRRHRQVRVLGKSEEKGGGFMDFIFNPYESKIPKEIEKEIYEAEANTVAAKDRGKRVALYSLIAVIGVGCAFFNGFLTELRSSTAPDGTSFVLQDSTFSWVVSNFLFQFVFTNKIGGGAALLLGAGAGLLAESEFDSRRLNAEKIWEEMQKRRSSAETKQAKKAPKKKRRSGKENKRLAALVEVVLPDEDDTVHQTTKERTGSSASSSPAQPGEPANKDDDDGLLGKLKGFYEKADSMAASQALLVNKKLEDAGLIEKITDETGLKVIGREAAAKLQEKTGEDETFDKP